MCMYMCVCVCVYTNTHTHIYVIEYYSAIKKNEILTCATMWINLDNIMLSEISQTENDKYSMLSLVCGI